MSRAGLYTAPVIEYNRKQSVAVSIVDELLQNCNISGVMAPWRPFSIPETPPARRQQPSNGKNPPRHGRRAGFPDGWTAARRV